MNRSLVLSILSDDKPGVVEALANVVAARGGNWMESSMSHLAGKFAGIVQISLPETEVADLQEQLVTLEKSHGIQVLVAKVIENAGETAPKTLHFSLMGNDRQGIIKELSQAFSRYHINLEELHTSFTSMPWSGDPMFTAHGVLQIPADVDIDELEEQLEKISDLLGVDIELSESAETEE